MPDDIITRWPTSMLCWRRTTSFCRRCWGRTTMNQNRARMATRGRSAARSFTIGALLEGRVRERVESTRVPRPASHVVEEGRVDGRERRWRQTEVVPCRRRRHPPAGRAREHPHPDQERFGDLLDRLALLAD